MSFRIYTKKGDKGTTALLGGNRISKGSLRIAAYGSIDTTNSYVGWAADLQKNKESKALLRTIQEHLFIIGSALSVDPNRKMKMKLPVLGQEDIKLLEKSIDEINEIVAPLRSFVLPGGHEAVSACHLARCHCRESERHCVVLEETGEMEPSLVIPYLNRLGDYLFMLARLTAKELDVEEILWQPRKG